MAKKLTPEEEAERFKKLTDLLAEKNKEDAIKDKPQLKPGNFVEKVFTNKPAEKPDS